MDYYRKAWKIMLCIIVDLKNETFSSSSSPGNGFTPYTDF